MAGPFDFTGQNIENTYQRVLQTPDGTTFYDGTGSLVTLPSANTASLLTTASVSSNTITFTKGDGSTFPITVNTGSGGGSPTNTGSLLVTASANLNQITFTKGDASQFTIIVDTGSATSIDTGSFVTTSSFNNFTSSYNTGSFTGSFTGIFNGTASWAYSSSQATSASYALSSSYSLSSSYALSSSYSTTASYALNGGVTQLLAGPNISLSPTTGLGQVTITSTGGGGGGNTATGSYGSFYDTTTQTNPVGNVPRSMSFNTTDITNGVSISGSTSPFNTYIKTENAGVYNIQFSAQIDKTDGGNDEILIWLRKNGSDLTDTATTITLQGNNDKQVAAWNWFVNSAANDYYQIIWISADTDMRLLAEPISGTHPGIPSVILTVNRIDQFLSNTGSFTGSFTGQLIGTASWAVSASNAISSSYALSSSYAANGGVTKIIAGTNISISPTSGLGAVTINSSGGGSTDITNLKSGSFGVTVDGQGSTITTGDAGYVLIPYNCTMSGWYMFGDQVGSIGIDLRKDTYDTFPAVQGDSICNSFFPTMSSAQKSSGSVAGWTTTTLNSGDIINFNVTSSSSVTRVNLIVNVIKS